jgi:predicted HTH domain antitoxin
LPKHFDLGFRDFGAVEASPPISTSPEEGEKARKPKGLGPVCTLDYWYTEGMEITLNLPEDIAQGLEAKWKDLPRAALESLALEAYRSGALTTAQVRRLLGFGTRYELDGFLKEHGIYLNYSVEDIERDAEISRQFSSRR